MGTTAHAAGLNCAREVKFSLLPVWILECGYQYDVSFVHVHPYFNFFFPLKTP
eukprot:SAG31_NODE_5688_length_2379_cov_3.068860_1_plen_52_part_10